MVASLHYREDGFVSRGQNLSEEEYGRVLDNCVVACVDVGVVVEGLLLMAKRAQEPYRNGWWVVGGRMRPGECREKTAQRVVQRETGLIIANLSRFVDLGLTMDFVWRTREQKPRDHGCHMLAMYYMLSLEKGEEESVVMVDDFLEHRWINIMDVQKGDNVGIEWHEAMRQLVNRIVPRLATKTLSVGWFGM